MYASKNQCMRLLGSGKYLRRVTAAGKHLPHVGVPFMTIETEGESEWSRPEQQKYRLIAGVRVA